MEWLFLTCHNYWIVCRLVKRDNIPFLAYSPKISIENSTEPFRALLGALLSDLEGASVEPSTFTDPVLGTIPEKEPPSEGPPSEDDADDGSGPYRGKNQDPTTERRIIRSSNRLTGSGLMVCTFIGNYPLRG